MQFENAETVLNVWLWRIHNEVNVRVENPSWPSEGVPSSAEDLHRVLAQEYEYHISTSVAPTFHYRALAKLVINNVLPLIPSL